MSKTGIALEKELFDRCLEEPREEWNRILDHETRADPALRERLRRMLDRHQEEATQAGGFLRLEATDPEHIGPYRILQRLGEGGMGIVYAAEQREPVRRRVAIKVLRGGYNNREVLARFDVERQALALMNHEHIARILDAGTTADHRPYIVMEFVPGEAITRYSERRDLSLDDRLRLFCDVCDAIQHAHQRGVIHRDLKPSNILIMEEGDHARAKVIDFGIAKAITVRLTDRTLETKVGSLLGTPDYMSPEQAELSALDVDTRTDVYALGAVLYQLLTGVPPLQLSGSGKTYADMQRAIVDEVPVPPSQRIGGPLQRQVRGELDWITLKALEKLPSQRYASPADFAADIRRHLADEVVTAGPPSRLRKIDKFVRRHWLATASIMAVAVTLAVSQVLLIQKNRELENQRDRANTEAETARHVSGFLVDVFRGADPMSHQGEEPTAHEILDRGRQQLEENFPEPTPTRVALLRAIGRVYLHLGDYDEALLLLRRSHADALKVYGERHEETLTSERDIGRTLFYQGKLQEALVHFQSQVARLEMLFGPDDKRTLLGHGAVATLLEHLGRPQESVVIQRRVQQRMRETLGPDHPYTIDMTANLGSVLETLGRYDEALPILEEVAAARERLQGANHPYTLGNLFNLAETLVQLGQRERAEALHRDVLARRRQVLGDAHADTFESMRALAELLSANRKHEEAYALMSAAHHGLQESEGIGDFIKLETQVGLARLERLEENHHEAERLVTDAIARLRSILGAERHPLLARAWRESALLALHREDHESALDALAAARGAGLDPAELEDARFAPLAGDPRFIELLRAAEPE